MRVQLTDRFVERVKPEAAQIDYFDEAVSGLGATAPPPEDFLPKCGSLNPGGVHHTLFIEIGINHIKYMKLKVQRGRKVAVVATTIIAVLLRDEPGAQSFLTLWPEAPIIS
jgi:hypothetical protein